MKCPYCNKELKCCKNIGFDKYHADFYYCETVYCEKTENLVGTIEIWEYLTSYNKIRRAGRKYYYKNHDKMVQQRKDYYVKNREKMLEYLKAYRAKKKEQKD